MSALRGAVEEGATTRPEEEKKLTRARRSVEKAISILEGQRALPALFQSYFR